MKTLYVVTNLVNNRRYIGIAVDFVRRRKEHIRGKGSLLVYRAIQKYGLNNIEFEPLVEGPDKWIEDFEIRMISSLETFGPKGYNLTAGGNGKLHCKHTAETKEKISKAHKGKILSTEHKRKISEGSRHQQMSPEHQQKLIELNRSRIYTDELRQCMRDAQLGKHDGGDNGHAIPVIVNGTKYGCIKDAAKSLGVHRRTIGRIWKIKGSNTFEYHPKDSRVVINDIEYPGLTAASKALKVSLGRLKSARNKAGSNTFSFQPRGVLTPITSQ